MSQTLEKIDCIVFDFGGTLSSQCYFWNLGPEFTAITDTKIWGDGAPEWCDPWLHGEKTSDDIADYLAELTGLRSEAILSALDEGCAALELHPAIWRFAQAQREQGRKTALVTLNMDVFTRIVVPSHEFDRVFDVIVNSSDHRIDDKEKMWEIAFTQLDGCSFENSLLIDDNQRLVERFRARDGQAYQYVDDLAFEYWLASRAPALFQTVT